ncbi:MAG: hypothetical protein EOP51_12125 [Sphingobacteriales bacterium]|nr:MAG: hypothetical protein EOP51_12125 [Sphingobacteriales bacterium]
MKFSIGDKVLLKRTDETGVVTAYINNQMLEIEVNGTTFPVYIDEVDHPYLKWFTEKRPTKKSTPPEQLPVEPNRLKKPKVAKGISLLFIPEFKKDDLEDIVETVKIYMANELPHSIQYSYDLQSGNKSEFKLTGQLHSFGNIYLHTIPYEVMSAQPRFHWAVTALDNKSFKPEQGTVRIRPQKLFAAINDLLLKNEPSFSELLFEKFSEYDADFDMPEPEIKKTSAQQQPTIKPAKANINTIAHEHKIDLHMEALMKNHRGLGNAEILKIQLDELDKFVRNAIVHHQTHLIIIHGIGIGTLRGEVHKYLKTIKEVRRFANEWNGPYGFGATEVWLKY